MSVSSASIGGSKDDTMDTVESVPMVPDISIGFSSALVSLGVTFAIISGQGKNDGIKGRQVRRINCNHSDALKFPKGATN